MSTPYEKSVEKERQSYSEPESLSKFVQSEVGFVSEGAPFLCKDCTRYIVDTDHFGHCTLVAGIIRGDIGTCNYFICGDPQQNDDNASTFKISKSEAVYMEREAGFACKNCLRYGGEEAQACKVVLGEVRPNDCCNLYFDGLPSVENK